MRLSLKIVLITCALTGAGVAAIVRDKDDEQAPARLAESFLQALDQDAGDAYRRLTTKGFRAKMTEHVFVIHINDFKNKAGGAPRSRALVDSRRQFPTKNQDIHLIRYKAIYIAGPMVEHVSLELENGRWGVTGVWFSVASVH